MEPSRCRSCQAEIIWVSLAPTGKAHPLDVQPRADGTIMITERSNVSPPQAVVLTKAGWLLNQGESLYVSHFATCPNAAKHRSSA